MTRNRAPEAPSRFRAITARNICGSRVWERVPKQLREDILVIASVLPFRTNEYVAENLIDWRRVPDDPIYQLTFGQRGMLEESDFARMRELLRSDAPRQEITGAANEIRYRLNPHPAGQLTDNVPRLRGRRIPGLQHKYRETVLFFPGPGQTCHAYCTYCFRWAQFVNLQELKFQASEADDLVAYLHAHPEVSDVLITGGDPMIMRTTTLRRYIEPLLGIDSVRSVRIGTKALAYWPQRFVSDDDAGDLLRLFEQVVASGRHLALMGHYSHPVELQTGIAREAVARIRASGAQIRVQAPVVRHVNDNADAWASLWQECVKLGMVPYYMFVERDTGPKAYFELPLARVQRIFREAYSRVSGLARTVRGPSMSAHPGKVRVVGVSEIAGRRCFTLEFLQARDPDWVGRPFFARFDPTATWLDELEPAFGERFFFERPRRRSARAAPGVAVEGPDSRLAI